ncbi:MAG: serine/threonine-protein kinase [Gemmatimonadota bacterium]
MTTVQLPPGRFPTPIAEIDLLRNAALGEYEIIAELGRGGMATVYLAHDITLGRKVAIKVMAPGLLNGPGMVERFKREARTAGALSHPHIIPVFAVRESERILYFIMKYVPGRTLESALTQIGAFPLAMAGCILSEAGGALDYAHRQGVIHRDVKPGNIMVDEEGFAVITDFGIAKATEAEGLTQTGIVIGTPSYVCPEACAGQAATVLSDQYSLGVVAYQLLTGKKPFIADSTMAVMYAQINTPPRPLRELRPDCPPELEAVVLRMMAKAPGERWPSVRDAVTAIVAASPPIDEYVRESIRTLARDRPERWVLEQFVTPVSPQPVLQPSPASSSGAGSPSFGAPAGALSDQDAQLPTLVTTKQVDSSARSANIRFRVLLAAVLALAVWVLGPWSHRAAPPVAAPVARDSAPVTSDSLLVSARGAAEFARGRAVSAGADSIALSAGDSVARLADSGAARGKMADAAVLLTSAAGLFGTAEKNAVAKAQKLVVNPAAPPRPVARVAPELTDSEMVVRFYRELELAIGARQIGEVKRLLPNLTADDERSWRALFDARGTESIGMTYVILGISRNGQTAYAKLRSDLAITKKGQTEHRVKQLLSTLTQGPQGWREIREEEIK